MRIGISIVFLLFVQAVFSQSIVVDDQRTAQDLVQNILFNNTGCATISNFSASGGDFGNTENSYGYFNANGSGFPFDEGIVLSTGRAGNTVGPNNTLSDDDGIGWGTDNDLETILPTSDTFNATILEFDFVPKTNNVSFEYIFASEEYQEGDSSTCIFSDVFAFLIRPVGGTYENIAVVPNTTIPVSVTTVHPEIPNECPAENEFYFGSWNDSNYQPINFNGQTAVLTAQKNDLIINQTYHIKLVIADHINFRYDSAVFLRANSFNIGIDLGVDRLITTGNALCGQETLPLDANIAGNSYQWSKYNDATMQFEDLVGENNQNFTVTSMLGNGRYRVVVDLGSGCMSEGEIEVEYDAIPVLSDTELVSCVAANLQTSNFNLFTAYNDISNGDNTLIIQDFYLNQTAAESETDEIPNPNSYENLSQGQEVIARVLNPSGCVNYATVTLQVYQDPEISADESMYYCTDTFPTTITLQSGFINGTANDYTYQWFKDGTLTVNSNETYDINEVGTYLVIITNADGCSANRTITVEPSSIAIFERVLVTENKFYKKVSIIVEVTGDGDYEYAINLDPSEINNDEVYQDENVFDNLNYGMHTLYIRDKKGCGILEKEILILDYPKFVTPNNDGFYDVWNINNINTQTAQFNTISNITIFDRYGKIMSVIDPNGSGWDGNFLGEPAPQSDYWFMVELIDYKGNKITKKGHFSLER